MIIPVLHSLFQTQLFVVLLLLILFISYRKKTEPISLSLKVSSELKGFAILAIIFAHIGYYLVEDHRFLFPLSISAGVGINLFLFLSGYGLTHSMLHTPSSILQFYQKRFNRIFIPLWIVLVVLILADRLFLHISYPLLTIAESFIGFFPKADLYQSLNAPFWYLTLMLAYYSIFPFIFFKKAPLLSSLLLGILGYIITTLPLPVDVRVLEIYQSHLFAFPLGVFCAALFFSNISWIDPAAKKFAHIFDQKSYAILLVRCVLISVLLVCFAYTSIHSGVGEGVWLEQRIGLLTMSSLILIFLLHPFENRFLYWVGMYSYEIYLIHWPLLYRYDFLYKKLPAAFATIAYLFLFLGLGWLFQKITNLVLRASLKKHPSI